MRISIKTLTLILAAVSAYNNASAQLIDESGTDLMEASRVYTLVNLHPDEERSRLYAVNYLQPGLIPRCAEVEPLRLRRSSFRFRVVSRDKEYEYRYHDAATEPFAAHLIRFFGQECNPEDIERLSELDQEGIRRGIASPGMTKQGIIYALGHPPRHVNPDPLDSLTWTYWESRFDRIVISSSDAGIVTSILD